jgi:cell wall-associated NlpC family hydrolase
MAAQRARLYTAALAVAAALAGPAHALAATPTLADWDTAQQRQVVKAGLLRNAGNSFQGGVPISAQQANSAMSALLGWLQSPKGKDVLPLPAPTAAPPASAPTPTGGGSTAPATSTTTSFTAKLPKAHIATGPVTVVDFDRLIVDQLGLASVAAHVQSATAAVGLKPPSYYGTEVLARYLGLRYDHPAGTDQLELYPYDPITRAEAAWSLAQVLGFSSWNVSSANETLSAYELPAMTADELEALRIAVSRIGYPYVWGGTTDNTADGLAHGGFDCSGFAWRVFKVSGLPWGQEIQGRTAAQQAGEIPKRDRLHINQLKPGDLLFFGTAHFNSTATESNVIHEGIYLGDNWVIHSSDQGVYVLPLKGSWLGDQFAWGRRVIT